MLCGGDEDSKGQLLCLLWWQYNSDAGWSSSVARRAHNPKVVGSNPAPATNYLCPWQAMPCGGDEDSKGQLLCLLWWQYNSDAGWSSSVARRAHNPKVVGSNPAPATNFLSLLRQSPACHPAAFAAFLLRVAFTLDIDFQVQSGCDPALLGIISCISSWTRALPDDATIYLSAAADRHS